MRNELFTATRGQGAQLNGYRLRCSNARDLDGTILATGFPFKAKQHATTYMNIWASCSPNARTSVALALLHWIWPTWRPAALTVTSSCL